MRLTRRSVLGLSAISAADASAQAPAEKGIAMGCCRFNQLSSAELGAWLGDIKALGTTWVRFDVMWNTVQPDGSSSWNWSECDRLVAAIVGRGMKPLLLIDTTPSWARPGGTSPWHPPTDPTRFGAFAGEVARRYGPMGVHYYEIWNEPNIPTFWTAGPNGRRYGRLLRSAHTNIKAHDPRAFVISAGLSPAVTGASSVSPVDFLSTLYEEGLKPHFDAVGHHPYCWPASPSEYRGWSAWAQMSRTQKSLRSVMGANGDGAKPIWMTEFGAPTGGPARASPVSEAKQAQMVTEAYSLAGSYAWAGPLFLYSYKDRGTDAGDRENFFGIVRSDGSRKPAYDAFANVGSSRGRPGRVKHLE